MPASKLRFKTNRLELELEGVEFTAGPEIVKVGKLSASLDVNDLLRTKLPELATGRPQSVRILNYGDKKIQVIKEVRHFTGMGLKEAKELTESAPDAYIEAKGAAPKRVSDFVTAMEEAGALVEILRDDQKIPTVLDELRKMLTEALATQVPEE